MTKEHLESFNSDEVHDQVSKYADPFIDFRLDRVGGKQEFVVIKVDQFDETPTICKKGFQKGKDYELEEGAIYTRTTGRRPETSKVMRAHDLRRIIELAVKAGLRDYIRDSINAGLIRVIQVKEGTADREQYYRQMRDFE